MKWSQDSDTALDRKQRVYLHQETLGLPWKWTSQPLSQINECPWPITTKNICTLISTSHLTQDTMSSLPLPNGLVVALKKKKKSFLLCQYNSQLKMAHGLIFFSECFNHAALSLRAGRQGNPVRAAESSADLSLCVQSNWKGEKVALWQQTAVNQVVHSHWGVQWAATEVASTWLISAPIKSRPLPVLLTPAPEVTARRVLDHSCSHARPRPLLLTCSPECTPARSLSSVNRTVRKAGASALGLQNRSDYRKLEDKRERKIRSKMTPKLNTETHYSMRKCFIQALKDDSLDSNN